VRECARCTIGPILAQAESRPHSCGTDVACSHHSETTKKMTISGSLAGLIEQHENNILDRWVSAQLAASSTRRDLISEEELRKQSREFLKALGRGLRGGDLDNIQGPEWDDTRSMLRELSRQRAERGFSPAETAMFILSLKETVLTPADDRGEDHFDRDFFWATSRLLDHLGLYTTDVYQQGRETIIRRQQQEILELSTPVVKLWAGVVMIPLIGTLDSARTQVVMESLLETIVATGSSVAIIDITGVPTVDTLVAQHLIKTVAAARLMGADCVISGIRPQIAQTIVHLGINLEDITTKATLADAMALTLHRLGYDIARRQTD
jgi:rsbT co-antagonist protein RsbR